MSLPAIMGIIDNVPMSFYIYLCCGILTLLIGVLLNFSFRMYEKDAINRTDAFGIVVFAWIAVGILGALPMYLEGAIPNFISALFESISGFTTTGATVINDVDSLSRATKLWRVLSHWLGGLGFVVLFVAIIPQAGISGKFLFRSESSGLPNEVLKPRVKQTALRLWWIYFFITAICTACLYFAGMDLFDAICHSFSTLATGGFSTKTASIGYYKSALIEWISIVFMILGGINFGLYYILAKGGIKSFFTNVEMQAYVIWNLLVSAFIFLSICTFNENWYWDLRRAVFQATSIATTTGLMTDDFDVYPASAKFLLFACMFMGGCAGSTAGGLKVIRILVALKRLKNELRHIFHPQEVIATRIGYKSIPKGVVDDILVFIVAFGALYFVCVFLMLLSGLSIDAAASSVVSCFSSVGPGFGPIGPTKSYEIISPFGKIVLCFVMIAGRLEIFALVGIFTRSFWKKG
jgi:trk system potassium uptake protein